MNDKLQNLLQILEAKIRPIAFFVGVGLLGAVFYISANDSGTLDEYISTVTTAAPVNDRAAALAIHAEVRKENERIEDTQFVNLITNSMFSVYDIKQEADKEKMARDMFNAARKLYNAGKYAEAARKSQEVLKLRPNHSRAKDLMEKIRRDLPSK